MKRRGIKLPHLLNSKVFPKVKRRIKTFPIYFEGKKYSFNKFTGMTFYKKQGEINNIHVHDEITHLKKYIDNPYLCRVGNEDFSPKKHAFLQLFGLGLTFLSKFSFYSCLLFSKINFKIFNTTDEAIIYYQNYISPENQSNLCLPRTLFAAATSKSFKKNGVLYIGIFLPSHSLHAWIIEDGKIMDKSDNIWILYQPVAMIYFN
jgi:hypothetical protein